MLSNLYLHEVLDEWLVRQVPAYLKGGWLIIRFADDYVLGFERYEDAERVLRVLPKRFVRYGLSLHPAKTRLVPFGRPVTREGRMRDGHAPGTFDFLGFTHYWAAPARDTGS